VDAERVVGRVIVCWLVLISLPGRLATAVLASVC